MKNRFIDSEKRRKNDPSNFSEIDTISWFFENLILWFLWKFGIIYCSKNQSKNKAFRILLKNRLLDFRDLIFQFFHRKIYPLVGKIYFSNFWQIISLINFLKISSISWMFPEFPEELIWRLFERSIIYFSLLDRFLLFFWKLIFRFVWDTVMSIDYTVSFIISILLPMSHLQFVNIELLRSVCSAFRDFFTALALRSTVKLVTVLTCLFTVPINVALLKISLSKLKLFFVRIHVKNVTCIIFVPATRQTLTGIEI